MTSRCLLLLCALFARVANAQVIEFESSGLKYKALTHNGVTIMVATLHTHVRSYAVLQVAISNGSPLSWGVRPEDFRFETSDGHMIRASPAKSVISELLDKASRGDVSRLISAYEAALFSNAQMHSTNGYEARRQDAMAEVGSSRLKAAAAASAIALVTAKLLPGQSTDGAVFYSHGGKPLGAGKLLVTAAGELFEFPMEADPHPSHN
jgi:hypothetical protein